MFRKEVLKHKQGSQFGEILVLPTASITISSMMLALIVVCAVIFLVLNDYEAKQKVTGILAPDSGLVKVFSPRKGFVAKLLIDKGEQVKAGQIVAVVQAQLSDDQGRLTSLQLVEEVKVQKKHLEAELKNLDILYQMEQSRLMLAVKGEQSQLAVLQNQLSIEQDKHQLAKRSYDNKREVGDKRYLAGDEINDARQNLLSIAGRIEQINLQISRRQNALAVNQLALEQLAPKKTEQQLSLQMQLSELSQQIIQAQSDHVSTIKAPVSGTVSSLQIIAGNSVDGAKPLLSIIPDDAVLEGKLLVPSRAVGFMAPGQQVRLRYDAFPYQRYGAYMGEVTHISKSTLSRTELAQSLGMTEQLAGATEAVYLVDVKLQTDKVTAYGRSMDLQVGMSFSADVILETRSLMQWLLDPLYSISGRL